MTVTKDCSVLVANYLVYALQYQVTEQGSNIAKFVSQYSTTFQFVEGKTYGRDVRGARTMQSCLMVFTLEVPCKLVCIVHDSEWLIMDWDGQVHICSDRDLQSKYKPATFGPCTPDPDTPVYPTPEYPPATPTTTPVDTSKGPSDVPWPPEPQMEMIVEGVPLF